MHKSKTNPADKLDEEISGRVIGQLYRSWVGLWIDIRWDGKLSNFLGKGKDGKLSGGRTYAEIWKTLGRASIWGNSDVETRPVLSFRGQGDVVRLS